MIELLDPYPHYVLKARINFKDAWCMRLWVKNSIVLVSYFVGK